MRIELKTGTLEVLKWLGVVLMFGDHINAGLAHRELPALTELGRLVFPIFAIVLGYNLARPGVDLRRVLSRLSLVATAAVLPHWLLLDHWIPLNVMYTFAAATWCLDLARRNNLAGSATVFLLAGLVVEYNWPGIALVLASVYLAGSRDLAALVVFGLANAGLYLVNGSWWALLAIPIIGLASLGTWHVQRRPWAFYAVYPVHLAVLALVAQLR